MRDPVRRPAAAPNPLALIVLGGGFAGLTLAGLALASGLGPVAAFLLYGLGGAGALLALAAAAPEPVPASIAPRLGRANA